MNERWTPYDPELAKAVTRSGQQILRELISRGFLNMNERIKELEMRVARSFDPLEDYSDQYYFQEFNRRFAELIVQECIDAINAEEYTMGGDREAKGMRFSISIIKNHFGVE